MPRSDYKRCRHCSRPSTIAGPLSHERLCGECARNLLIDNIDQMHARSGPNFQRWRRNMALCAFPELRDLLPPLP